MMLRLHTIDCSRCRISELPDDIVVSIVSFLTIKEAIATSVLSRRWRHLWKYTTRSWRFNLFEVCKVINGVGMGFTDEDLQWKVQARNDYITLVNQALESHRGPFLYELRICICHPRSITFYHDEAKLHNWISIASRKCVRRLHLQIPGLFLERFNFSQLTHLTLIYVSFRWETLYFYLSSCPLLEHLCLSFPKFRYRPNFRPILRVGGGSLLKLKHLEVSHCHPIKYLEITATNLESFVCRGLFTNTVLFKDVPLLSTLSIDNLRLIEPLSFVSQIEKLTLEYQCIDRRSFSLPDMELSNLKHLELRIKQNSEESFLPFTYLLKASPLLSSLKIDLGSFSRGPAKDPMHKGWRKRMKTFVWDDQAAIYQHQCLIRVVTLCGFLGYVRDTELALHLIGMATSLEKMVIDCCSQEIIGITPEHLREERSIARQSAEELRTKLLPTTKFIIL